MRETDVTVAWVEAHNPGWVRQSFLPFCQDLEDVGWDLPPSLLIPVLVTACGQNPDLRNIPSHVWKDRPLLDDGWSRVKNAIEVVRLQNLQALGVPLRLVPSADADGFRSLIPIHSDHRFRRIPITDSDSFRSVIPIDSDHLGVSE